ncbi:MAG: transcriptional regulator [Treponema sp.]|nr:transcriptional regulator [Treponema sp.]
MEQGYLSAQADDDFTKARNKALFNELQHLLNPEEAKLISFADIKKMLKPSNEVYKGMQVVPISLIVGSEGRYKDFDNHFFPKRNFLKTRWEHVDMAHYQDITLPPVSLYELGGLYFVRDGNHRVSVAKMKGIENIDAEVVSLQSEIKLKPGSSKEQIVRQVIEYEKRVFYAETSFGDITDFWCLNFTTPGQYDIIYSHILCHKYYINSTKKEEIPMEEAILSWFHKVYLPVTKAIENLRILKSFKGRTLSDLYVYLTKHWDELKAKFGNDFPLEAAAEDFLRQYGRLSLYRKIKNSLARSKMKKNLQSAEHKAIFKC